MEKSQNQKILKVISIIEIVLACIGILFGIMGAAGGGLLASDPTAAGEIASEAGLTAGSLSAGVIGASVGVIIANLINILIGVLGLRASKDATKIMPVWYFAIAGLVLGVIGTVASIATGTGLGNLPSLALSAFVFWVANNIKAEAGL